MEATDILMAEHRIIERVLAVLHIAADRLEQNQPMRPGFFIDVSDFIQGFADGCHHRKEEGVLFEAMVAHGMSRLGGPIAVMLADHEQGRSFTRGMLVAAQKLGAGDASAREAVIYNARGYVTLLQQHIMKEDHILFPMANQVIPASEYTRVAKDFERLEHEEIGEGMHEKYLALVANLEHEMGESS
jgi:hemerythrin-like domain-containing protein